MAEAGPFTPPKLRPPPGSRCFTCFRKARFSARPDRRRWTFSISTRAVCSPGMAKTSARRSRGCTAGLTDHAQRDMRGEGFDPATARLQFLLDASDGSHSHLMAMSLDSAALAASTGGLLRLMATIETANPDDSRGGIRSSSQPCRRSEREIGWAGGRRVTAVHSYRDLGGGTGLKVRRWRKRLKRRA